MHVEILRRRLRFAIEGSGVRERRMSKRTTGSRQRRFLSLHAGPTTSREESGARSTQDARSQA